MDKKIEELVEWVAKQIKDETDGGYLEYWGEFSDLLSEEQQSDYFGALAKHILSHSDLYIQMGEEYVCLKELLNENL